MLTIKERLLHSTVRIETLDADGNASSGTGFFYNFGTGRNIPVLVTNKHVVEDQPSGFFHLSLRNEKGEPDYGNHGRIKVTGFADSWLYHPDPNIDLAVFPVGPLFNNLEREGKHPFWVALDEDIIPKSDAIANLDAFEEITMIGYPNGLGSVLARGVISRCR